MDSRNEIKEKPCNIIIENRNKISISGVEDVDCFDEDSIALITTGGTLIVKGNDFHINRLSVETGELIIEGNFDSCQFDDGYRGKSKGSLFAKMFK